MTKGVDSASHATTLTLLEESRPLEGLELQIYNDLQHEFGDKLEDDMKLCIAKAYKIEKDPTERTALSLKNATLILEWRQNIQADQLLTSKLVNHDDFFACWPTHLYGQDKHGHLINAERICDLKADKFVKTFDVPTMLRHRAQIMEQIRAEWVKLEP